MTPGVSRSGWGAGKSTPLPTPWDAERNHRRPVRGGAPHIKIFSGSDGNEIDEFLACDPGFTSGVYVAPGDIDGEDIAEIITSAGPGRGPHLKVFQGTTYAML